MPNENLPGPGPELQPSPTLSEPDPVGAKDAAVDTSFGEKIRRRVATIFERHGVTFRAGRGRPRKDGLPKKSDVPLDAAPTALPAGTVPPLALGASVSGGDFDPALVRRCVSALVKAVRGFVDRKLWRQAVAATGDSKFAAELVRETTITQDELDGFSELTEICLRKYGVGTQYAPEIGLVALVAGVGVRYAVAFQTLESKLSVERFEQ